MDALILQAKLCSIIIVLDLDGCKSISSRYIVVIYRTCVPPKSVCVTSPKEADAYFAFPFLLETVPWRLRIIWSAQSNPPVDRSQVR